MSRIALPVLTRDHARQAVAKLSRNTTGSGWSSQEMAHHSQSSSFSDDYYNLTASPTREDADALRDSDYDHDYVPVTRLQPQRQPQLQPTVKLRSSLAQIHVPSFRSFASSIPVPSPSATKRKPIPFQLPARSPRAASFSLAEKASPRLADPALRPLSLDSPLPQQPNGLASVNSPPLSEEYTAPREDRSSYTLPAFSHVRNDSIDSRLAGADTASSYSDSHRSSIPIHTRYAQEHTITHAPKPSVSSIDYNEFTSPERGREREPMHMPQAPSMTLQFDGVKRTLSDESLDSDQVFAHEQRPKSGSRLGSFFGWKSSSQRSGTESPTTTFSDRSLSPLPSPVGRKLLPGIMDTSSSRLTPPGLDIQKANSRSSIYFDNPDTPILLGSPETNAHVKELEKELAQVSSELAGSIRREMDLEDEVDRLKAELPATEQTGLTTRRSSDYFSDSGTSSVRYPISNPDERVEQLEQKLRRVEQEKAQSKVEVASTLQAELARRRDLEQMVANLEEQLHKHLDDEEQHGNAEQRIVDLEASLEESKRRLSQERQAKDSVEDVFRATRETESHLRARVETLEGEAKEAQALGTEKARMQQELDSLREEMQKIQGTPRFNSIAEEGDDSWSALGRGSLSRSNSLARARNTRPSSITRTGSVKEGTRQRSGSVSAQSTFTSSEAVKEIEDQRDALHEALKLLISRHDRQQRDHQKAMKKITSAKDKAEQVTPKRTAYHREVSFLKDEVTTLRKRTEDALEQKWQYEKGLSGVKMDLDRAEQETSGLRILLEEHDVFAPNRQSIISGYGDSDYGDEPADTMELSIATAEEQREKALQAAEEYRHHAQSADPDSSQELMSCAQRMDGLAQQLDQHVQANMQLRDKLADAVTRGEREQKESTKQIEEMQSRLAGMEDSVLTAQQHSETMLGNHESELRRVEEATSPSLQRLRISIPDAKKLSPPSPLLTKSPRLGNKKLSETSLLEASRTQMLERKVRELEGLLKEAEDDVQTVVQTVTRSQLEVADLQTQRDAALTQMRKLQNELVRESEKAESWIGR